MSPHELAELLGGFAGVFVATSIPITTLRAWFARDSSALAEIARAAPVAQDDKASAIADSRVAVQHDRATIARAPTWPLDEWTEAHLRAPLHLEDARPPVAPDSPRARVVVIPFVEKSPGRPAPLLTPAVIAYGKHSPVPIVAPVEEPAREPCTPPVPEPDFGEHERREALRGVGGSADRARARAREVRDAVAGLGWPIARAAQATEAALHDLGGGCPELEDWVPAALRVLAPAAKRVPALGNPRRDGRR